MVRSEGISFCLGRKGAERPPCNLDASGFVTSYVTTTSVVGFQHAYDAADNKLSEARMHDTGNSEAYDYDSAYRLNEFDRGTLNSSLTEVTTPTTTRGLMQAQDWTLDGPGNWPTNVTTTGGTPTTENRTHNNLNQITAVGPTALQYDANGNLTDDGTFLYAWDAENRLRKVTRKSDSVVVGDYSYDALGRRILRVYIVGAETAKTVHYYLDGPRVIEERQLPTPDSLLPDELARQYTYGLYIDEALTLDRDLNVNGVATDSGERLFYHANSLYSVSGLSDSNRNFAERYLYDGYGRPILWLAGPDMVYGTGDDVRTVNGSSTVQNVRLFTGRELDGEAALYQYRARYESPRLGRFLSRDPAMYTDGVNPYAYVSNQPTGNLDPTGRQRAGENRTNQMLGDFPTHLPDTGSDSRASREGFYVCKRLVDVDGIARKCGCQHTIIYGDKSGPIYDGWWGPDTPDNKGLPKGEKWKCKKLTPREPIPRPFPYNIFWDPIWPEFQWGPKAGQSCEGASSADIIACLAAKPAPGGQSGAVANCQTDVYQAAQGCCLTGFVPLSFPPRPVIFA